LIGGLDQTNKSDQRKNRIPTIVFAKAGLKKDNADILDLQKMWVDDRARFLSRY